VSQSVEAAVIAPGNYDGVHLGHQALLRSARSFAQAHGLSTSVLTFDPHPGTFLGMAEKPVLTRQPRRAQLLTAAGADRVFVQHFTHAFAALSPEEFIESLLSRGARALVVGPDFRFGKTRAGDVDLLMHLARERGFSVLIEPPVLLDGERVSSSAVREALSAGNVLRATKLLGRVHEVQGKVVVGNRRGRSLGFPTANVSAEAVLPPADGVYAVVVRDLGGQERTLYRGVANLGTRPTFEAGRSVEVHMFDFDGDLYDRELRVGFIARIRGEHRFSGVEELKRQIQADCDRARELLSMVAPEWTELL
jgi:riboflavin kinase/FMN adenylyltransferase